VRMTLFAGVLWALGLYSALRWLPAERLQRSDILRSLKVNLDNIGTPSSLTYRNQTLESYVCSNAGSKGRTAVPNPPCDDNEIYGHWTCLSHHFRKKHVRACKRNSRNFTCLLIPVYLKDERSLRRKFGDNWPTMCSRYYGRKEPFEAVLSSQIIQSCNLTTPGNGILHLGDGQSNNYRCSILSSPHNRLILFARIATTLLLRSPTGDRNITNVTRNNGCWDPEMTRAQQLYLKPGRWDVDNACIDVIQAVCLKIGVHLAGIILEAIQEEIQWAAPFTKMLYKVSLSFLAIGKHYIREMMIYRLLKKFRALAKERRSLKSGPVVVSCQGLRGTRRDVLRTVATLVRLGLVQEIMYSSIRMQYTMGAPPFHMPFILMGINRRISRCILSLKHFCIRSSLFSNEDSGVGASIIDGLETDR